DFAITARPITITADAGQTKVYGETDPAALTYSVTSGSLAAGDSFDGALSRDAGETVGSYAINQGTLTIVEGATNKEGNYTVTYVSNDFAITA
ncbi:MBG domain-containing protein, partial [uncultured Sunxiuqinia sp.]|uniref:MBG domain-containing protein n=1 Tax=uncultured Sunxiuqinia sp. TaxID=1573825 RepID=UPI002619CE1C